MRARLLATIVGLVFLVGTAVQAQPTGTPTTSTPASPTPAPAKSEPIDTTHGLALYYRDYTFGVGLNAGLFSGAGLSGRFLMPQGLAFQLSFFVISVGQWTHFNIGGEAQYSFARRDDWRLYSVLGMGYYTSTTSDTAFPGNRIAEPFRLGLGVGYEWFVGEQFTLDGALALTYFASTSKFLPTPRFAMHFYFR
jgi:hypothetical protein